MKNLRRSVIGLILTASVAMSCTVRDESLIADPIQKMELPDPIFQQAQADIDRKPDQPHGYVNLAVLYMKEARKTGDFSFNLKAAEAVERALEISPVDFSARKIEASLHLAHHRFSEAVAAAEKLKTEVPSDSFIYGVLTDAYIEVGEYEKAIASAQRMVDLKPGTASYSRVAQLRSLHGDHKGAVEMYEQAARASDPNDKETQSWCLVQLGDEYWKNGRSTEAEKVYDEALQNYPGYFLALVAKGFARAAAGDLAGAEQLLNESQARTPNANAIHILGDISMLKGDSEKAQRLYAQFDAIQESLGDAADHRRLVMSWADRGKLDQALAMATSEYAAEKSIHSAELLAWSLFRSGRADEARKYIREAMRLKTNDARMLFHAGMIAKVSGDRAEAKRLLGAALKLNPAFDLLQTEVARKALAELG